MLVNYLLRIHHGKSRGLSARLIVNRKPVAHPINKKKNGCPSSQIKDSRRASKQQAPASIIIITLAGEL